MLEQFLLPGCAALIILAVLIVAIGRGQRRKMNEIHVREQRFPNRENQAVWGQAVILHAQGGLTGDGASQARFVLSLQVTGDGGETYRAKTTWLVDISALGYMHTGETLSVKIDPVDKTIIYPNASWAQYVG